MTASSNAGVSEPPVTCTAASAAAGTGLKLAAAATTPASTDRCAFFTVLQSRSDGDSTRSAQVSSRCSRPCRIRRPSGRTLSPVRIVSLVPSATELLFALGLGDEVIAVTHECDYPPEAAELPHITYSVIPEGLPAAEIDARVRELPEDGEAIYGLDEELLIELEPDLIVTQALCAVCAVSYDDVRAVATEIATEPKVISLDPRTLGEVMGDVRTLAQATGRRDEGVELIARAAGRIDRVRLAVRDAEPVRVAALEWFDPVYVAGHWTPQLIEYAGGEDVLGLPGEHSEQRSWDEVAGAEPDVVVAMPCGYDAARSWEEALDHRDELRRVAPREVIAVDAAGYFTRPGPRVVDGLEVPAPALPPDAVRPGRSESLPAPLAP